MIMARLIVLAFTALIALSAFSRDIVWHSADSLPLLGKAVDNSATTERYQRIPDSLLFKVRGNALSLLGRNSAGMAVRFASDSPEIRMKWHSLFKNIMNHQTPTGTRGLDLYTLMPDGSWVFVNSARPDVNSHDSEVCVISNMEPVMREYLLYLPLYDGIDNLYIGTTDGSVLTAPSDSRPYSGRQIVFYGTSLLQGGCANRPGMAHTNILTRRLNREVVNLGFSGNGQLDLEIAHVIAAMPDPGLIVLECVPNASVEQISTLLIPFYEIIRKAHPDVPFLFIEDPIFPHLRFDRQACARVKAKNEIWKKRYEQLAAKDPLLHYLAADHILGLDNEATVDGLHFTDLGFMRYSDLLEPIIRRIAKPVR